MDATNKSATAPRHGSGGVRQTTGTRNYTAVTFTRFTTADGTPCGKRVTLDTDGTLVKQSLAQNLHRANQERVTVASAAEVAEVLDTMKPSQALAYGVSGEDFASVVTRKAKEAGADGITRTRNNFAYLQGGGAAMLDYDLAPGAEPMTKGALVARVGELCPEAREAAHLWRPSASSCIYRDDGTEVRGIAGQRVYLLVKDATDIPRAGAVLHERAWLAGHGFYLVSKSGALLDRGPFDAVVWQPERLDYCGGADCGPGLEQRLPPTEVYGGPELLDTREALPDLTDDEQAQVAALKRDAKSAKRPEQERVREQYIEDRAPKLAEQAGIEVEQARETLRQAMEGGRLLADFALRHKGGTVTVGEVLDNPEQWHGCGFLDPLEPDYQPDNYRIARVDFYGGGRPFIWSFAHGGRRFTLHRQPQTVRLSAGDLPGTCDRTLEVMRLADPELFQRGVGAESELVAVVGGHVIPACNIQLRDRIGRIVRFERFDKRADDYKPTDCPGDVAVTIHRRRGAYGLRDLKGVITAPTMRPDGSLLTAAGYDPATGLLLLNPTGADFGVPLKPDRDMVRRALAYLWRPFRLFPLAGDVDRAVLLSALLTAAVRRALGTAPGFLLDASTAGSGKTLVASCVGYVCTGSDPDPQACPEGSAGDDELKKMLFAALRTSDDVLLLDNIDGTLRSAALAAILTKPTYTDRVLGESRRLTVASNVLFLATGNGVTVQGDLNRRLLRCTIAPEMERPDMRQFDFNPLDIVKQHRVDLVRCALLLMRAYLNSGTTPGVGAMASFETWDGLVRQTVCWLAEQIGRPELGTLPEDMAGFKLADPLDAISAAYEVDPEKQRLAAVLQAWCAVYGEDWKTVKQVRRDLDGDPLSPKREDLRDALVDAAGGKDGINPRTLSWYFRRFNDRIVDGMRFEYVTAKMEAEYRVAIVEPVEARVTTVTRVISNPNRESVSAKLEIGAGINPCNPVNPAPAPLPPEEGTL